ncbi:hypothetical protein OCU04_001567 [Sclerotinia nivalis]|uniref:Uncharacterized protein n=1 Tax=Sclerotinia nivalis TaxID=352851 RepID=A0A9X0AYD5_9HELO|nr:hypothetical protein OCU04_001567 [Sclerotinia nivalis]
MTPPPSHNSSDLSTRATPHTALFISILQSIDRHFPSAQVEIDMALGENWLVRGPLVGILREAMGRFGEEVC